MPLIIPAVSIYDEKLYIFTNCIKEREEKDIVYTKAENGEYIRVAV